MSEFALGQRWVSHADVELGLGIVVELELRRVTLHFPAVGEDRTYAMDRAPLTRLALKAGDTLSRIDGHDYEVIAVDDIEGLLNYAISDTHGNRQVVSELEIDPHIQLSSPRDRLLNNQLDKLADFKLRYATLSHRATPPPTRFEGFWARVRHCSPIKCILLRKLAAGLRRGYC